MFSPMCAYTQVRVYGGDERSGKLGPAAPRQCFAQTSQAREDSSPVCVVPVTDASACSPPSALFHRLKVALLYFKAWLLPEEAGRGAAFTSPPLLFCPWLSHQFALSTPPFSLQCFWGSRLSQPVSQHQLTPLHLNHFGTLLLQRAKGTQRDQGSARVRKCSSFSGKI